MHAHHPAAHPATLCYHILGRRVAVRSTVPHVLQRVRHLFRSFPSCLQCGDVDTPADVTFSFSAVGEAQPGAGYTFARDAAPIAATRHAAALLRLLECELEAFLADAVRDYYLLHAGALAYNGAGIILPAPSGSGKTSLVLALLQCGYGYLSDELAVIEPATGNLHAFPKPLTIKDARPFAALRLPALSSAVHGNAGMVAYLHPHDTGARVCNAPLPVRAIIFPHYDAAATPTLQPLAAGQALRRLFEHTFNAPHFGSESLHILAPLVRRAACFALTTNDLAATTALVDAVMSARCDAP